MGKSKNALQPISFKLDHCDIVIMPNDEGGTRNSYVGIYLESGRCVGTLHGKELRKLARALRHYENATSEIDGEPMRLGEVR